MPCDPSSSFLWNIDPVFFHVGNVAVRYYTVCFFLVCLVGYLPWQNRMLRGGHSAHVASRVIPFAVFGILAGGRLVHCLFYETDYYLAHPLEILDLRRGGLASHGSSVGLVVMFVLYSAIYRLKLLEMCDRFAISTMIGASFVRLGNFFNSEIVGTEWCGPWAVRYERFAQLSQALWERSHEPLGWEAQPIPRHPAQLYEWAGMLVVGFALWWVDHKRGEDAPRGQQTGLLLILYFSFRFALEAVKEFQRFAVLEPDFPNRVIHILPTADVTMGQWLSLPFVAIGIILLLRAHLRSS
jgi:phosphatidylglycerol:prolipoprotein diacylglycerol transferase